MPGRIGDGEFVKLCPDGMSAELMVALFGHQHDHHAHAAEAEFAQCDLGGGIGAANSVVDRVGLAPYEHATFNLLRSVSATVHARATTNRPRDPPSSLVA